MKDSRDHSGHNRENRTTVGWTIRQGTPLRVVSDGLVQLLRATAYLRPQVSVPLKEITLLINKHVFGEASKQTQDALAEIDSEHETWEPEDDGKH